MESLAQVLEEMKEAYRRIAGGEPPITPGGGSAFPPSVDPAALVMGEVQAVRSLSVATAMPEAAPTPSFEQQSAVTPQPMTAWMPPADVWIGGNELAVDLELVGCAPGDVRVSAAPGCLEVSGTRREPEEEGRTWLVRERPAGPFMRRLPLPGDANLENVTARFVEGVLYVRIPLAAQPAGEGSREVPIEG
jgi:HSP20 family molecular chaperone IbpA